MAKWRFGVMLLVLSSAGVGANTGLDRFGVVDEAPRSQTERWLQLQREGNAASRHSQAATPAEQELANQRWLDSYRHAIPDFFEQGIEGNIGN